MKYYELEKQLSQGIINPVYLFTGKEIGLTEDIIEIIKEKTVSPAVEAFNVTKFDTKDTDYSAVIASCETLPVMSEYRMIIIGNQADVFNIKDEKIRKRFEDYISNPSKSTVLIILSEKPDKRKKLYKLINKKAVVVDISKLDYKGISKWVKQQLKGKKKKITPKALDMFLERTHYLENESVDTLTLKNHLLQLCDYADENSEIDESAVSEVIPESVEDNVFKLIDMAVSGKLSGIPIILDYFWEHKESPIRLFGLVLYQLRNIVKVNLLLKKGMNQGAIASKAGLAPFIVRKTVPIARNYDSRRLLELFNEAAELDFRLKTGQVAPEFALEYLLLKLNKKTPSS